MSAFQSKTCINSIYFDQIRRICNLQGLIYWKYFDIEPHTNSVTLVELSWIGCLTSQLTIFQSYMWRHIDVQADWRSWTYGRAPNAIDIS